MSQQITCRFCGASAAVGATTCPSCGARLVPGGLASCLTIGAIVLLMLAALPLGLLGGCAVLMGSGEPHAWEWGGAGSIGTLLLVGAVACVALGIGLCIAYARRRNPRVKVGPSPAPPSGLE